jgi:hypothetical protein
MQNDFVFPLEMMHMKGLVATKRGVIVSFFLELDRPKWALFLSFQSWALANGV